MSMYTIPQLTCTGCFQCVCTGSCLASHRDRYCCHNPSCQFHAPCPLPPLTIDQGPAQLAAPSTPEADSGAAASPPNTSETEGETSLTSASRDPTVIFRETVTREWRLVDGVGAPATVQAIVLSPSTTSGPTTSTTVSMAPVAHAASSADVDRPSTPPARFTIEEYQAQARLLAQYEPRQDRQPRLGQRDANTLRSSGGGQETSRRPRVQILLE